jgi:Peptidase S46
MINRGTILGFLGILTLTMMQNQLQADEGMWLFNNPPRAYLKSQYKFEPTDAWLDHVQKSSVRFNSGGSGSFVSANGLVMTNHHVGADALQKMGDRPHNYLRDGFYATSYADERKCTDLELNVLMSIEDVTARVNAAVSPGMPSDKAAQARRKVMATIEKEAQDKTGLRSDVITLYQGGLYHLYSFKKYTDVRLVFAPEQQAAFYGGDPDNFEYPRFDLDICFFRVYENDKPIKAENFLKWSPAGCSENELVLVSGHPGRTNRLATSAELENMRDVVYPYNLQRLNRLEVMLSAFSGRSEENARQARELFFTVQNSRKARQGGLAGLLDPAIMKRKRHAEENLKRAIGGLSSGAEILAAWDNIASAEKLRAANLKPFIMLESPGAGFQCTYFQIARTLVRAAAEKGKPNGDRLREFRDSNLQSLELELFSEEPLYDDFEQARLESALTFLAQEIGYSNSVVQAVFAGKSPNARAAELIHGSKLRDVSERKRLYEGGAKAIEASTDPMIQLAKLVDDQSRHVRKLMEEQVDEVKRQAYAKIASAKFAVEGASAYPDATFTLRLAFGVVKPYEEGGKKIPSMTTMAGLYARSKEHDNKPPFDLPPRWVKCKDKLDLSTPFNFVCTADIIGGNSGSPVINKNAEVVGIIFDGNIQSLVLDFIYAEDQARAVSVDSRAIIEALRKVYDAGALADELQGKK